MLCGDHPHTVGLYEVKFSALYPKRDGSLTVSRRHLPFLFCASRVRENKMRPCARAVHQPLPTLLSVVVVLHRLRLKHS